MLNDEYIRYSCKNIIYEILKQNDYKVNPQTMFSFMIISIFSAMIPYILYFTHDIGFKCENDWLIFYLSLFPMITILYVNLLLFQSLFLIFKTKMYSQRMLLTMVEHKKRPITKIPSEMP